MPEKKMLADIEQNSESWENLLVLADDIGVRVAGGEGEIRARDFLLKTFARYGLDDVHLESFRHRAWQPKREELLVTSEDDRPLACRSSALSPSTPQEGLEGEVVFLERCDEEELAARADEVRGRMVAAPYYPVARQLKTPIAARCGASALLEYYRKSIYTVCLSYIGLLYAETALKFFKSSPLTHEFPYLIS